MHTARVTVVVLCVCMYVCMCVCMCVHSYLPPHTLESQKRDTNGFIALTGIVLNFADFPKNALFKSYGMPTSSSSIILSLFPHEISFYAGLKPIATFSLHRQWACGRQCAIRLHRLMKWHRYTNYEY